MLIGIGYTLNLRIAKEYLAATILKNRLLRYQAYYLIEMVYSDADARTAFTLQ